MRPLLDLPMLKLHCVRARMEAPNIANRCARELGLRSVRAAGGCTVRCNGLVAASLLHCSNIRPAEASTIASALTCMERAFVMHTRERKHVLVGDALLGRVFRHMGTLDTAMTEFVAISAEKLIGTAEALDAPTVAMVEASAASRDAWTGALAFCGVSSNDMFAMELADQRRPSSGAVETLTHDRATRDAIMTLVNMR